MLGMNDFRKFQKRIFLYSLAVAGICEGISLLFLGFDLRFLLGLLLGTAYAMGDFNILAYTTNLLLSRRKVWIASASFLFRMCLYAVIFVIVLKSSLVAALGCGIGFLTLRAAVFYLHGIKAKYSKDRKIRPEVQAEFDKEDREKEIRDGWEEE